jgi:hypothetical protein
MKCCDRALLYHSRIGFFFSYNRQWILDLCCCSLFPEVAWVTRPDRQLVQAPPGNEMLHQGLALTEAMSRKWNVATGPCYTIAEWGTFSHIIVNGFWTCVVLIYSLRWPQLPVGTDTLLRHLQGMKCCTRALLYHRRIGHFSSYILRWISDLCCCVPFLEVASTSRRGRHLVNAPAGNEMFTRALLYHRRTGHFSSYNLRWILNLCCCIPFLEVASTSRQGKHLVKAPAENGMLHQALVIP